MFHQIFWYIYLAKVSWFYIYSVSMLDYFDLFFNVKLICIVAKKHMKSQYCVVLCISRLCCITVLKRFCVSVNRTYCLYLCSFFLWYFYVWLFWVHNMWAYLFFQYMEIISFSVLVLFLVCFSFPNSLYIIPTLLNLLSLSCLYYQIIIIEDWKIWGIVCAICVFCFLDLIFSVCKFY